MIFVCLFVCLFWVEINVVYRNPEFILPEEQQPEVKDNTTGSKLRSFIPS